MGYTIGFPPDWYRWEVGTGAQVVDSIVERAADTDVARDTVRRWVWTSCACASRRRSWSPRCAGVWVPDRSTGQVHGTLLAEGLVDLPDVPDPVGWFVSTMGSAPRRRGVRTFEYTITRTDLPAGPAAVQSWTSAHRPSRDVVSTFVWTVVPPGAVEAIGVEFSTHVPALADALYQESVDVLMSLRVEIA